MMAPMTMLSSPSARAALFLSFLIAGPAAAQELRGHGGPVRAIAIAADGRSAMTGSFDQSAILWQLESGLAEAVLRFHEGAVNAVASLPDGHWVTGGEDGRIAIWTGAAAQPSRSFEAHKGPVSAIAVSADGQRIATAAWDETVRITDLVTGEARALEGHKGPVNGVAIGTTGEILSVGYDGALRIWPQDGSAPKVTTLGTPLNGVVVAPDGEIVVAGADGRLRFLGPDGSERATLDVAPTPIIALAISRDGRLIAAGGLRGQVPLVARATRQAQATLVGPGLPVWSLGFSPDGRFLYSGGADRIVRQWDATTGQHIGAVVPRAGENVMAGLENERGAQVFRACAACHTLTPADGNRAGPTLHGLFGRRIASQPGYSFSPALKKLDIVWTKETVAKLFEIGPAAYTPGTKMPEQTISSEADRQALVDWLEKVTRPNSP